ncbi:MAG: hypothetical protein Q4P23_03415 [Micrococcaceae bacterium]|nr:hypothetical protein [Micrococcaceae bacterium]
MPTFDEIRVDADKRQLVRKIQKAIACIAPMSVELPESLFTVGGTLIDVKTLGFKMVGLVTPDGYKFGREVSSSQIDALGYASSIREDVTAVVRSITATPLQSGQKHMSEIRMGADFSAVTQDPVTGEVVLDEPDLPINGEYRLLVIGSDGPAAAQWILGRGYGVVKLSTTGEEAWGSEGAVSSELNFSVSTDEEIGTPTRHYMGGTGALAANADLGFTLGTP